MLVRQHNLTWPFTDNCEAVHTRVTGVEVVRPRVNAEEALQSNVSRGKVLKPNTGACETLQPRVICHRCDDSSFISAYRTNKVGIACLCDRTVNEYIYLAVCKSKPPASAMHGKTEKSSHRN